MFACVVQKKKKNKKSKEDKEKTKKKKSKKKESKAERRPFDRDKDLAVSKMDDTQRKSVISRSKELGGRFGHGATQFLWWIDCGRYCSIVLILVLCFYN